MNDTNWDAMPLDKKVAEFKKEDGYLYIQGHRITNNKDGIRTVYSSVMGRAEEGYIDVILSIDYNGYVVIAKHQQTNNQVSRFLNKILG